MSQEQKTHKTENIEKHTPLNYTGSYKQNKVSFIFTSAGVMTGNSTTLETFSSVTLQLWLLQPNSKFQTIFQPFCHPAVIEKMVVSGREEKKDAEKSGWAAENHPAGTETLQLPSGPASHAEPGPRPRLSPSKQLSNNFKIVIIIIIIIFFLPITILVPTENILNCVDKLPHDHQKSRSCLILLGNFSTVALRFIWKINKTKTAFSAKLGCCGASEFCFSRGSFSGNISLSHCHQLLSVSRENHQFIRTTNSFCSLQRGKPVRRHQHEKKWQMR